MRQRQVGVGGGGGGGGGGGDTPIKNRTALMYSIL